jgi:hypothetical protein
MLLQLQALFDRHYDLKTAAAMANIKTRDGLLTARVFWGVLERIAEMERGKESASH